MSIFGEILKNQFLVYIHLAPPVALRSFPCPGEAHDRESQTCTCESRQSSHLSAMTSTLGFSPLDKVTILEAGVRPALVIVLQEPVDVVVYADESGHGGVIIVAQAIR